MTSYPYKSLNFISPAYLVDPFREFFISGYHFSEDLYYQMSNASSLGSPFQYLRLIITRKIKAS